MRERKATTSLLGGVSKNSCTGSERIFPAHGQEESPAGRVRSRAQSRVAVRRNNERRLMLVGLSSTDHSVVAGTAKPSGMEARRVKTRHAIPSGLDSRQPDPPAIPGGDGIVCVIVNGRGKVCGS